MISVEHLNVRALRDVTLRIPRNSVHLLLGANGAGKSTLLYALAGILEIDSGNIHFDGKASLLMQESDYQIFGETVLEDLLIPFPENSDQWVKKAQSLAESFGLPLNARTRTLSFGQKRKLALAASLMTDPDILLLDEPTAGLDWPGICSLIRSLQTMRTDRTILIATHDATDFLPLLKETDTASLLFEGRLSACGRRDCIREIIKNSPELGIRPF